MSIASSGAPSRMNDMHILYIEDNLEFRQTVTRQYLGGHQVTGASDGDEGVRLFDTRHYDLVLLDYQMNRMHGPEVLRHIRSRNKGIPVVAFSMDDALNQQLLAEGATEAIPKRDAANLPELLRRIA